ncbi:MAG: S49 family peptidase, partial [Candidatus Paceibacterota bacterium]
MTPLRQYVARYAILALGVIATFSICLWIWGSWHDEWSGYNASSSVSDGSCNIAIIPIVGNIIPYAGADQDGSGNIPPPSTNPDDTLAALRAAEADPNIRGVLVRIDSSGGSPVAAEVIANGLRHASLPLTALIREVGVSAAYLAATGAKTIIASPFSDIGSIGVTMSYIDNSA